MRWPTADGSAVDRNSVPASGVISTASVSNTALGPAQLTKESEAKAQVRPTLWYCGDRQFEEVLAIMPFFHVFGMRTDAIFAKNQDPSHHPRAQGHPSADPDVPQIPNTLTWYNSIYAILVGVLYVRKM